MPSLRRGAGGMASFIKDDNNLLIFGGEEPAAL